MIQCKRFRWEDEFNEWAKKENIQSHHVVAIESSPPDSMMIFYDKNRKEPIYNNNYCYQDWISNTTPYRNNHNSDSITIDGNRINMTY